MSQEAWFHVAEIVAIVIFGSPTVWVGVKVIVLLKEFGLHKHGEKIGPLHAENMYKAKSLNGD